MYLPTNKIKFFSCVFLLAGILGCEKVEKGFLSDNIFYRDNPLVAAQGSVTVSAPLVTDGSTNPLNVILQKVTNDAGEDVTALVTKTDSIMGFSASVTYLDSTLALLNNKIAVTAAKPLTVAEVGGRIELTPATEFIPLDNYYIHLKVTNIRSTKELPNACKIILSGSGSADTVYADRYAGTLNENGGHKDLIATPDINVTYYPNTLNRLVYKYVDKNGVVYNPKANGISVRPGRWDMHNFNPYYPQVLTDTAVEYEFPVVPNQFPVFPNPGVNSTPRGNFGIFPSIPAAHNSTGLAIYVFMDIAFFKKGTFIITTTFSDVEWK